MLQRLTILILFFSFFNINNSLSAQSNDLIKENLKGKAKKVISYYYNEPIHNSEKVENGELTNTYIKTYNEIGNELLFDDGTYQSISKYDKNGFKISYHLEDATRIYQSVKIINDSTGHRASETVYDARKEIIAKRIYKQNENKIEMIEFSASGIEKSKKISKYNQYLNKIEEEKYDKGGDKLLSVIFRYDKNQLLVYESQFNFKPIVIYSETTYRYNDNKDIIYKKIVTGRNIVAYKYYYEYDRKQNWIKKIKYENDNAIQIQEREIKYFN